MSVKPPLVGLCAWLALAFCAWASSAFACYTIVVGKDASVDGSVLVGHNEQNTGERFLNFRKIPRMKHAAGDVVNLHGGGHAGQVAQTYAFLWSENPGISFSDSYMNEWGVVAVSDGCPDRGEELARLEADADLRDGGIGYMLRRLVVERAKTAREGVKIAGAIIEEVGYCSSRTLVIADSRDGWLLSMTRGRQWVAQRVPDDKVVLLPNVYIINEVDLEDGANFIASENLVGSAVEKGWWQESRRPFLFSEAYGQEREVLMDPRQWKGQCMVTARQVSRKPDRRLPFAVSPANKMGIKDVVKILRNHEDEAICSEVTQEGGVFQLRGGMPAGIGCVWWRAAGEPCTSVLVPWYAGISETPKGYYKPVEAREHLTLEYHFGEKPGRYAADDKLAWWVFRKLQDRVNMDNRKRADEVRLVWNRFEEALLSWQGAVDSRALKLYGDSPEQAWDYLTDYCAKAGERALREAGQMK